MEEIWKNIKGYERMYQISNLGRVKSLVRKNVLREKIKSVMLDNSGYPQVNLCKNNYSKIIRVHKLMAIAFLNHKPNGHKYSIDHIDNDKSNNNISNLQIITHRENLSKDRCGGSSEFVGVVKTKNERYISTIQLNGIKTHLGTFKTEKDARDFYLENLELIKQNKPLKIFRCSKNKYKYISWHKTKSRYILTIKGVVNKSFKCEEEAYRYFLQL
jgi:hypothetical protein